MENYDDFYMERYGINHEDPLSIGGHDDER